MNISETEKINYSNLIKYGSAIILVAIFLNTLIYSIVDIFDVFSDDVINPSTQNPIPVTEIIFVSIIQMVLGIIGFAIASEVTNNPIQLFRIFAFIFLILSFYMPFTIEGRTIFVILSLELMHIISGSLMIKVLPKYVLEN